MPRKCPLWAGCLAPLSLGTAAQQGFEPPLKGRQQMEPHGRGGGGGKGLFYLTPTPFGFICRHGWFVYVHLNSCQGVLLHHPGERKKAVEGVKCSPPPQLHVGLLLLKYD